LRELLRMDLQVVGVIGVARDADRLHAALDAAGCASGEEAYSLAIVFAEAMGADDFKDRVKVYATDVDEEALAQARSASYGAKQMEDVEPALRERYFDASNGR